MILSMGGQIPNNLAVRCAQAGMRVLGTSPRDIDRAENRHTFSRLLDDLDVPQPPWQELTSVEETRTLRRRGRLPGDHPALLRALRRGHGGGRQRRGARDRSSTRRSRSPPTTRWWSASSSRTPRRSTSTPWPGTASWCAGPCREHVENAGVHSGDATLVLPPQRTYLETMRRIRKITTKVAESPVTSTARSTSSSWPRTTGSWSSSATCAPRAASPSSRRS